MSVALIKGDCESPTVDIARTKRPLIVGRSVLPALSKVALSKAVFQMSATLGRSSRRRLEKSALREKMKDAGTSTHTDIICLDAIVHINRFPKSILSALQTLSI